MSNGTLFYSGIIVNAIKTFQMSTKSREQNEGELMDDGEASAMHG